MIDSAAASTLLAFARCAAFAASVPLGLTGGIPKTIRAAVAVTLTPITAAGIPATQPYEAGALIYDACGAAVSGAALGLSAAAVAGAALAAGGVIDNALASQ
ncbi:MAG: flagellar biosynthetic protein FliR, partial [Candidatus Eremiobacteraeota bacterium]|nr:flagellar biosynthetic protein FliR [Candidatus Eremiobacteraeota bacterium]